MDWVDWNMEHDVNGGVTSPMKSAAWWCNGLQNREAALARCLAIYRQPRCGRHANRIGGSTNVEFGVATVWAGWWRGLLGLGLGRGVG